MSQKKSYLKITKADKSVHFAPIGTKAKLTHQNSLRKDSDKYKLEEVELTDEELAKHPKHDNSYVPASGNNELALLKKVSESKDKEIEELKRQLDEKSSIPQAKAADVIAMINEAESAEEVDELLGDDTRVTVVKAAEAKKASLATSQE